jgi:hypothetical protein
MALIRVHGHGKFSAVVNDRSLYAACCCSATAVLMNSAMPERVG